MKKLLISTCFALGLLGATAHAQTSPACADPADYGAITGDGLDDGPAIRAALAANGDVCLESGEYDVTYVRGASIVVDSGKSLKGQGPSTVIVQLGDAHAGSWNAISVQGGRVSDLWVYQNLTNPDPSAQNHMIEIDDGDEPTVDHVFLGPGSTGGGDCLRLLGANNAINHAHINSVVAMGCMRSGIGIQHGVNSGTVTASVFNAVNDSALDYEPSSFGNSTLSWTGNIFVCTSNTECVTLSDSAGSINDSAFTSNFVLNGNMQAVRAMHTVIADNTIIGSANATNTTPVVDIIRDSVGVRFHHNYVVRPSTAGSGSVVRFVCNNGGCPDHAQIDHNQLEQNVIGYALEFEGLQNSEIDHNEIYQVAWSAGFAMSCRSVGRQCDALIVDGNQASIIGTGTTKGAWRFAGYSTTQTGRALVVDNMSTGYTYSAYCENGVTGPIRVDDNIGGAVACTGASVGTNL